MITETKNGKEYYNQIHIEEKNLKIGYICPAGKIAEIDGPFVCIDLQNNEEYHYLYYSLSYIPNTNKVQLNTDGKFYKD